MNAINIEKILKFVQKTGEKFIVVFAEGDEPVVLMPFHTYEAQYEKIHSRAEMTPSFPLTTPLTSDTIPMESPQSLEKKPAHIRDVLKERSESFSSPTIQDAEPPSINSVPPEDRYYFEPIE